MKVVLFCGGFGMRLYPSTENIPKPMVHIGHRPILWHLMKYYSFFGHKDFILCLGYKSDQIKRYFLNYDECLSNDFIMSDGGKTLQLFNSDIKDWKITFADTGLNSNVGQRLKAVEKYLEGEPMFLANYSDAVTDLHLPRLIDFFITHKGIGCFVAVKPPYTFHIVSMRKGGPVKKLCHIGQSGVKINGGFFVFRNDIFNYINEGEDLVNEPFQRLIEKQELMAYEYDGFWANMDTYKDKQKLDDMFSKGETPWQVWKHSGATGKRAGGRKND